jgi:hypothetical protein
MHLLDTNVISELRRPEKASPAVVAWAGSIDQDERFSRPSRSMSSRWGCSRRSAPTPRKAPSSAPGSLARCSPSLPSASSSSTAVPPPWRDADGRAPDFCGRRIDRGLRHHAPVHDRHPQRQALCANQRADHQPLGLQVGCASASSASRWASERMRRCGSAFARSAACWPEPGAPRGPRSGLALSAGRRAKPASATRRRVPGCWTRSCSRPGARRASARLPR